METNSERRRRKLAELCAEKGIYDVAESAGLNWQSLDQIIKGSLLPPKKDGTRSAKNLGNDAARKIEIAQGLGIGWFDTVTHSFHVTASTPENQPNVAATHVQQAQVAINNGALSDDALHLARWFDDLPEGLPKKKAFTSCMLLISDSFSEIGRTARLAELRTEEMSLEESPYPSATDKTPTKQPAGHHAR